MADWEPTLFQLIITVSIFGDHRRVVNQSDVGDVILRSNLRRIDQYLSANSDRELSAENRVVFFTDRHDIRFCIVDQMTLAHVGPVFLLLLIVITAGFELYRMLADGVTIRWLDRSDDEPIIG